MRSRFTLQTRLDYYGRDDLTKIVNRSCDLIDCPINQEGAEEIASRARGTPRIANNLIHFARDFAQQRADGQIDRKIAADALELLEIDHRGLDEMDKRILILMAQNYKGGPVGLGTIAVGVGEEEHTLEEVHEPFLIQEGYIQRTAQGRVLTATGWEVTGIDGTEDQDPSQLSLL
jgi:Holliday junction DNA helicase RuvB